MAGRGGDPADAGAPMLSRRAFLSLAAAGGAALAIPSWLPDVAVGATCPPAAFRNSLSVSPFTEQVLQTLALTDGTSVARTVTEVQQLFNRAGATEVYARIATRKVTGVSSATGNAELGFARGLERAMLAARLGLPFNPELGLFANYGDGATYQQPPDFSAYPSIHLPGPWTSLTLTQMLPALRQYGALVAEQILSTGVTVNYWDIGNEVDNGVAGVAVRPLFPDTTYVPPDAVDPQIGLMSVPELVAMPEDQRIAFSQAHLWPYVGRMLAAVADGIRSVDRRARFSTHISHFGDRSPAVALAFWETVSRVGYLPDQLGTSYYPTDGKTTFGPADMFGFFKDLATALGRRFNRQLFIAEYGYPSALMQPPYPFNDPVPGYTMDEAGQRAFTRDLIQWGVTSGHLAGIRPWAPDFCDNSAWLPMAWFHGSPSPATPKPVLAVLNEVVPPRSCPRSRRVRVILRIVRRHGHGRYGLLVRLHTSSGTLHGVTVELRRGRHVVARRKLASLGVGARQFTLHPHSRLPPGRYHLVIRHGARQLTARTVTVR